MADEGEVPGREAFCPGNLTVFQGVQHRLDIPGAAQEFARIGWRRIAGQHLGLLADVTAGMAG